MVLGRAICGMPHTRSNPEVKVLPHSEDLERGRALVNRVNGAAALSGTFAVHWLTLRFTRMDVEAEYLSYLQVSRSTGAMVDFARFTSISATAIACFVLDIWIDEDQTSWPAVVPAVAWLLASLELLIACLLVHTRTAPSGVLWYASSTACLSIALSVPAATTLLCFNGCSRVHRDGTFHHAIVAQVVMFCAMFLPSVVFSAPFVLVTVIAVLSSLSYLVCLAHLVANQSLAQLELVSRAVTTVLMVGLTLHIHRKSELLDRFHFLGIARVDASMDEDDDIDSLQPSRSVRRLTAVRTLMVRPRSRRPALSAFLRGMRAVSLTKLPARLRTEPRSIATTALRFAPTWVLPLSSSVACNWPTVPSSTRHMRRIHNPFSATP